jgi:apolipoprotein D and lipocalin family protein
MHILLVSLAAVGAVFGLAGLARAADDAPSTVAHVDLARYAGTWYEVARFPNRFQKRCTDNVVVHYTNRPDGRVDVLNTCRTADGTIIEAKGLARRATADGSNSKLEVRFAPAFLSWLPAVWGDYWILSLADDYSWAIIGDRARKYLWLLSRTPTVDEGLYRRLVEEAAAKGYDTGKLARTRNAAASSRGTAHEEPGRPY